MDTGFKSPTIYDGDFWTNPTNAYVQDDTDAVGQAGNPDCIGNWSGFDFGIPVGAVIKGIEVLVRFRTTGAGLTAKIKMELYHYDYYEDSIYHGELFTEQKTEAVDTISGYIFGHGGGATDIWTPTRPWRVGSEGDFGSHFTVTIRENAGTGNPMIDHIKVKVYYTVPGLVRLVVTGNDDCLRNYISSSFFGLGSSFIAGYGSSTNRNRGSAARFLNITIPPGSTIISATLKLTGSSALSATIVNTRLRCEKNINPLTFSTSGDFDARVWTDKYINWDAIGAWSDLVEYESPDIKDCIQEVINLAGWASGNAIVVLWDDFEQRSTQSANRNRIAYSYNGDPAYAPKLYIDYTLPPPVLFKPKITIY